MDIKNPAAFIPGYTDPAQAIPVQKPGLLDLLFPGGDSLSPEARKKARNQGLLQGGLALMAASGGHGPGEPRPNFGQSLFGALNIGQQAAGNAYGAAEDQQMAAQTQAVFRSLNISPNDDPATITHKLEQAFLYMLPRNPKAATSISEVLKSRAQSGSQPKLMPIVDKKTGRVVLVDPRTGETVRELQMSPADANGSGAIRQVVDQKTGLVTFLDPRTGKVLSTFQGSPKSLTETQSKAKSLSGFADLAVPRILADLGGADGFEKNLAALPTTGLASQLFKGNMSQVAARMSNNAFLLADAYLRTTSGAAYGPTEVAKVATMFNILSTDDKETIRQKVENMRQLQQMLRIVAGDPEKRAAVDSGAGVGAPSGFLYGSLYGPQGLLGGMPPVSGPTDGQGNMQVSGGEQDSPAGNAGNIDVLLGGDQ